MFLDASSLNIIEIQKLVRERDSEPGMVVTQRSPWQALSQSSMWLIGWYAPIPAHCTLRIRT